MILATYILKKYMRMRKKILFAALCLATLGGSTAQAQKKYKAYIVSNAHLDTQWNWDVHTTIDEYLKNTLTRNLYLLKTYPGYIFNFEGGVKYEWMKEYYPLEYEVVKKYIKEGRWHVAGSSWDANDPNIPSPESSFRNILLGQQYYKKEFGVTSRDIFLPDCFGFGYTLPTIAAHAGLIGFSTQKLQWRQKAFYGESKFPFNIGLWQGVDGSRIMAAANCQAYVHHWNGEDISKDKDLIELAAGGINNTAYRYYGTGDKGGSADINSVISLSKGMKGDGDVEILSATSDQLYLDYYPFDKHPELPVFDGELLMDVHGGGCYTSQAAMKRFNRRNEQLGDAAERISVVADYFGGVTYPAAVLTDSWKRFIWHQFHDDLTGTSLPKAYTYSWNDELIAQSRFADIIRTGVGTVTASLNTRVKGIPVVVYNSMAAERNELIEISLDATKSPAGVRVLNADGKELPAQLVDYAMGKARITFSAAIAPMSCAVYEVRFEKSPRRSSLKATSNTLENSVYKLTLDANGDIASIWDKRFNRELVELGKPFRLALFTENESNQWPAWEIHKTTMDATPSSISDGVKISIAAQGPSSAALRVERTYGTSRFVQTIRMTEGGCDDRIDIVNNIDWDTRNALLKAEFPLCIKNPEATYDLGIGTIKRGNNTSTAYEVCAQQWADITDKQGAYGVAILNDCKYGWDKPNDNTLRLTLLHAPKTKERYKAQEQQDLGHHTFTYSIVGHSESPLVAGISHKAESLNTPLAAFVAPKHSGKLGRSYSFLQVSTPQVAIRSFKKAEESDMYVLRLYELKGESAKDVEVIFPTAIESAYEMNGVEDKIGEARIEGNKLRFDMSAYRPKTLAVRLKKAEVQATPVTHQPLQLSYTENAFTPDAFGYLGKFDPKGNTYVAELIGDEVVSENIPFTIAPRDEKNVVKCKGDTVYLPQGAAYKKLYLLAASVDKNRKATFLVDGKPHQFDVPYYSGFYGQWGNTGFSEGFITEAPIAYLGSHRHSAKGNDSYTFTYMYKFTINLPKDARMLVLPQDENIAVFAATLSDNYMDDVTSVNEVRALPYLGANLE